MFDWRLDARLRGHDGGLGACPGGQDRGSRGHDGGPRGPSHLLLRSSRPMPPNCVGQTPPGKVGAPDPPTSDHPPRIRVAGPPRSTPGEGRQTCSQRGNPKCARNPFSPKRTHARPIPVNPCQITTYGQSPPRILDLRNANKPSGKPICKPFRPPPSPSRTHPITPAPCANDRNPLR